jgi:hypothetical protein
MLIVLFVGYSQRSRLLFQAVRPVPFAVLPEFEGCQQDSKGWRKLNYG